MARPATIFTWATSGSKTDPGAGRKTSGFRPGETLPAHWLNWLLGVLGDWITWINAQVPAKDEANTFAGNQTVSGGGLIVNGAAGDTAAILDASAATVTSRRLIFALPGTPKVRVYALSTGGLDATVNARWDGANWQRDASGYASRRKVTAAAGLQIARFDATATPTWADGSWYSGKVQGRLGFTASGQPGKTDFQTWNELCAKNLVKVWGVYNWTGVSPCDPVEGFGGAPSLVKAGGTPDRFTIYAWDQSGNPETGGWADANWLIMATLSDVNTPGLVCHPLNLAANGTFELRFAVGSAWLDSTALASARFKLHLTMLGNMTRTQE